jgi:hypothetical protein
MPENFPKLMTDIKTQTQRNLRRPRTNYKKKNKNQQKKRKDDLKILKAGRKKKAA